MPWHRTLERLILSKGSKVLVREGKSIIERQVYFNIMEVTDSDRGTVIQIWELEGYGGSIF